MEKLILFDIDGTLMDSGGAGKTAMELAILEVLGIENALVDIDFAGSTDLWIFAEALKRAGVEHTDGLRARIVESYLRNLPSSLLKAGGSLKPGAQRLVSIVASSDDMVCGLLTGNLQKGAFAKLAHFRIDHHFSLGAFGDDDADRNKLLPIAVDRAFGVSGRRFEYKDCILIGDTPKDVKAALTHGALCLGVATGPYRVDQLLEAGAFTAFEDLSQTETIISLLRR
jgi:phosphoglycolate phosphatase-like HAD superfamily hydrolase